jgi:threonine dehydratase
MVGPPTLDDVRRAADTIRGSVVETPTHHSRTLSAITGAEVFLKFENLQFTASFKDRGALVKLLSLSEEERRQGVFAMSAGNHALAVAYHARRLGIHAVIVMPRTTPSVKVEHTRGFGAEVILHGTGFDEAAAFAERLCAERRLVLVHPYDDERIIAGQGTLALEILAACPDLEVLVVPVGGGGLIAGIAIAAKGLRPAVSVVGVESARFPAVRQALAGEPIVCGASTIAEGIAVKRPGRLTLPLIRALVDAILVVEEDDIEEAVLLLLEVEKTVVEGAGAVGLAALGAHRDRFAGRRVGVVLSGGNIDATVLSAIILRGLVRSGRLVRLRVELPDTPGALAGAARLIGDADGNIVEVRHQRAFATVPVRAAEVEFVIETRGVDHARAIVEALARGGLAPRLLDGGVQGRS